MKLFGAQGNSSNFSGEHPILFEHSIQDENFTEGWTKTFREAGAYDFNNSNYTFPNDEASALYVPEGFKGTLHEHSSFDPSFEDGATKEYVGPIDVKSLADDGINDWTSHIKVEKVEIVRDCTGENRATADSPGDCGDCIEGFAEDDAGDCQPLLDVAPMSSQTSQVVEPPKMNPILIFLGIAAFGMVAYTSTKPSSSKQ